jgi:hypothetical protein
MVETFEKKNSWIQFIDIVEMKTSEIIKNDK